MTGIPGAQAASNIAHNVTGAAGGIWKNVKSILPYFSVASVALIATAVLTGGGSTALTAAAASKAGIGISSMGAAAVEGAVEGLDHITNGASWVASHLPTAAKSIAAAAPTAGL
jgi:Zn-dependent alcohol dehydrogenase